MKKSEFKIIREEIKKILKANRIKYSELAKRLEVSESGIKKMLTGKDLSFNKISSILDAVGLDTTDFFQSLKRDTPSEIRLTEKQESFFYSHPIYYSFFCQLLNADLDWNKIKKNHQLNQATIELYLTKLDRLDLIELLPGNKVRSKFCNGNRVVFGTKLAKKVVDEKHQALLDFAHIPNETFRGKKQLTQGFLKMKQETAHEFNMAIRELVNEYISRSKRESLVEPKSSLEEMGFLFVLTPTKGMKSDPIPNLV